MNDDKTMVFNISDLENYLVTETLLKVKNSLDEKGYNGINQIVGYLTSGDINYISNYKDCRKAILRVEKEKIVETLLKSYLKDVE